MERVDDIKRDLDALGEQGHTHGKMLEKHEYQLTEHGKRLDAQGLALDRHADALAALPPQLLTLRDHIAGKVSIERYVWIERVVLGAAGAAGYWLIQQVLSK